MGLQSAEKGQGVDESLGCFELVPSCNNSANNYLQINIMNRKIVTTKPPSGLQKSGRELWRKIAEMGSIDGVQPLLQELCKLQDRLTDVRATLEKDGLIVGGKKHVLADLEPKLSAQFQKIWKLLGLADDEPTAKRPPGRPTQADREQWRG